MLGEPPTYSYLQVPTRSLTTASSLCAQGARNAGLWTTSWIERTTVANPDFSGICFLDLNVELLLELSHAYLHYAAHSETCVECEQLPLWGNNYLIGSRVLRCCSSPLETLNVAPLFSRGILLWRHWRPTCSRCLSARVGTAGKQVHAVNTVTAFSLQL